MAIWKYSGKEVAEEDVDKAVKAVREAYFKCGKEMHKDECTIHQLVVEIQAMKGSKEG